MNIEFEAKFYIHRDRIIDLLKRQNAQLLQANRLMKRRLYGIPETGRSSWLRVRDEGDKVTLSLKSDDGRHTIDSVKELELIVSDFNKMNEMVQLLGFTSYLYIENYRETWQLADCYIMIDKYPALDTFIEIEGPSEDSVHKVIALLELDPLEAMYGSNSELYQKKYSISAEQFDQIKQLTFSSIPDELSKT